MCCCMEDVICSPPFPVMPPLNFLFYVFSVFLFFVFFFVFFSNQNLQLLHCRYGRVQSVKIITTTTTGNSSINSKQAASIVVAPGQPSPLSATITSTTNTNTGHIDGTSNNINGGITGNGGEHITSSIQQHITTSATSFGSNNQHLDTTTSSPSINNSSSSCINNNNNSNSVSSSCHHHYNNQTTTNANSGSGSGGVSAIGICATIAFMDIKSASKAHTAEHKFDDRILTTEYYEPTSIHHGSSAGDSSLMISSQMTATALCPTAGKMTSNDNDMKIEIHGRFTTSTSSSHGLVSKKAIFWISFNESNSTHLN